MLGRLDVLSTDRTGADEANRLARPSLFRGLSVVAGMMRAFLFPEAPALRNARARRIADHAASHRANRAANQEPGDRTHGAVTEALLRARK
ncbi:hypothetical protein [Methylocapsa aurea]|uniref:hypothetical protein n=1 Tax=Methylocapsa aurea TaxID=663610 RepID=UPI0012EC2BC9|nr:hypothetical protein [Methylocapsa aurea]